ncbi:MAG: hypothetical protein PHE50_06895 [Dehalococcoidales bacterium]|nr:hypothetical protein [Dehalococcoidales bacterium]
MCLVPNPAVWFRCVGKHGEPRGLFSKAEFQPQDVSEENLFKSSETVKMADYTISNDGTLDFRRIRALTVYCVLHG